MYSPGKDNEASWLPSRKGPFNVALRMYWPAQQEPTVVNGPWKPPAIRRVQ